MATLEIAGRKVSVTNLDKVLFPETGTTKSQVIEYYTAVAPAMLPHMAGRAVTRKRWPNGVDQPAFFEKNLASSAPDWLDRREMQHSDRVVTYPLFSTAADLAWLAQQASVEAHVPQWRFDGNEAGPATRMVFDLDPGDDVDLARCAEVACEIREMIAEIGFTAFPVTSGSKGIHLYVPLEKPLTPSGASTVAKRVATLLEERSPDRVTATMAKAKRTGRVFVDWSQNNGKKTTVAPYSMRGRPEPTVAAPRSWDELENSGLRQLRFEEVLERFHEQGDLLENLDPPLPGSREPDKLTKYRSMRSASKTPEPIPDTHEPRGNDDTFVIQEHHARRLHYDFRLEHDGVLVSWAVPKNIPDDPGQNRLAVHTEDHPLEYATFSGSIPKGEYGGGEVSIWDSGTYELEKWRDDEVIVVLHGAKAKGRFALIKTRGDQWLMHLMKEQAATKDQNSVTEPSELPNSISPMLATAGDILDLPDGEWAFEGKWDGFRVVARIAHGAMKLESRSGKDLTQRFHGLSDIAADLSDHEAVLDGEAVVFDSDGVTSFELLQGSSGKNVRFIAFDLLYLNGTSLVKKKYSDRRKLLELLTTGVDSLIVPDVLTGSAEDALTVSVERGWEGVVAKRVDSVYQPGKRAGTWIKTKNWRTQEVVVGGWRRGRGRRGGGLGSLLVGVPGEGGLQYLGRVGTGFSDRALDSLSELLDALESEDSPFAERLPTADRKDAVWVTPTLVGEVRFYEWTDSMHLRHPSWRGLRDDKQPEDVVLEN